MPLDFSKWAILSPKTATGFGRMAEDAKSVLGIPYHFVSDTYHLSNQLAPHDLAVPAKLSKEELIAVLRSVKGLQAILSFETLKWHPLLSTVCKELGIQLFCIIMWEWFGGKDPIWKEATALICPSSFTRSIVESYGHTHTLTLPWVLDLAKLPKRSITGPASIFGHNAGVIDGQDRKGTLDTLRAFSNVKDPKLRLKLNYVHSELSLPRLESRVELKAGAYTHAAELFAGIDVAIQPSKMEGIGFMVLEAVCSGLPTISLNYPPMNTYVQNPSLLVSKSIFKRRALSTHLYPHSHLYLPNIKSLSEAIAWCTRNDLSMISENNRAWAQKRFDPIKLKQEWVEAINPYF